MTIPELPAETGTSMVIIDRVCGEVLRCSGPLFGQGDGERVGRNWQDALGLSAGVNASLVEAITSAVGVQLPPAVMSIPDAGEVVVSVLAAPQSDNDREVMVLLLRPMTARESTSLFTHLENANSLAVLGIDRLEYSANRGVGETARLMMEVRAAVQQVLRDEDYLGLPTGAAIPIVLRDVEPGAALDICSALLSHVHELLSLQRGGFAGARACIGLCRHSEDHSPLSTLVRANNSLARVQASAGEERARFAGPFDALSLAARAINAGGVFADAGVNPSSHTLLASLVALPQDLIRPQMYLWHVLELLLKEEGVFAAGLLKRTYTGGSHFLSAAVLQGEEPRSVEQNKLPRVLKQMQQAWDEQGSEAPDHLLLPRLKGCVYTLGEGVALALHREDGCEIPSAAVRQYLCGVLPPLLGGLAEDKVAVRPMETGIEGYVQDNMEGAIDQAVFLAGLDMPVAIIGPAGTGKMYVAQVIHKESGAQADALVRIDCRSFRNKSEAQSKITRELTAAEGKTLVFKSPHLMPPEVQAKFARQLSTRTLVHPDGPRYLPQAHYVALFPDRLEHLIRFGGLNEKLASVFAGYPIQVPAIKDRRRAILRWAHKILQQESTSLDRRMLGFTPDAEQAMLRHDWPGNISEMRDTIRAAMEKTGKEWISPVDLGLFLGLDAAGSGRDLPEAVFLQQVEQPVGEIEYSSSALEDLGDALGQALHNTLELNTLKSLGAWLDDEIVLAACERYRDDTRGAAQLLQTRTRNIGRWMPRILSRDHERSSSLLWQECRKCVGQWIQGVEHAGVPPQECARDLLLAHVLQQCGDLSVADRARIMGVSAPTYQKRLKQLLQEA